MIDHKDEVVIIDLHYKPEGAVSGAVLITAEGNAWLTFNAVTPGDDGLYHAAGTAVVTFPGCQISKFGYPNDEALSTHPLYPKMHGSYDIYEVLNSSWIAELDLHRSGRNRHFIITFHDNTFECIARDILLEVTSDAYETVFGRIGQRLVED